MGYGATVDAVIGQLSRFLHVRKTITDTSADLGPYLDASLAAIAPLPPVPQVKRAAPLVAGSRIVETLSWRSAHVPLSPRYRARHETVYEKNQTAYARWMHPRGGRRKSVLVYVHGWLEPGSWVEEATLMPLWYRDLGVDVAHLSLPFHGRRSPRGQLFPGEWFWTADLVRSFEAVRQALTDLGQLIRYFRSYGYEEIGVSGISLGGSITMLSACVEPLPDYIVPIIAHLELVDAVESAPILSRMREDLDAMGIDKARRKDIFSRIPLASAQPLLPKERQLWVAAKEDGYLRASLVEQQWHRWGEPPILWIEGGHMTFPMAVPAIVQAMKKLPQRGEVSV